MTASGCSSIFTQLAPGSLCHHSVIDRLRYPCLIYKLSCMSTWEFETRQKALSVGTCSVRQQYIFIYFIRILHAALCADVFVLLCRNCGAQQRSLRSQSK